MENSDKILFRCPDCQRTFRVPASRADRKRCPECTKLAADRETVDRLEVAEQQQRREGQRPGENRVTQSYRPKRSWFQRLYDGWVSMRKYQKRRSELEQQRLMQGKSEIEAENKPSQKQTTETLESLRSYSFLTLFCRVMFAMSLVGVAIGGAMILDGFGPTFRPPLVYGIILFVSSVSGLATALLIELAMDAASDIEETKQHVAAIEKHFRHKNARENNE